MKAFIALFACIVGLLASAAPASAGDERGATSYFSNLTIAPSDVVNGNVTVFFANANIDGQVNGDVNVIGGACEVGPFARIAGHLNCANGTLAALAPFSFAQPDRSATTGGDDHLYLRLASAFVTVLLFLLFPLRTRLALDRLERHSGISAIAGLGGFLAIIPIVILLVLTIVGLPLIPVVVAAGLAFVWIGIGAIALLIGRRLSEVVMPRVTPAPFAALLLGLVVITAAEMLPKVGGVVTAIVYVVGFGATLASFVGAERLAGFAGIGRSARARGF